MGQTGFCKIQRLPVSLLQKIVVLGNNVYLPDALISRETGECLTALLLTSW